MTSYLIVASHVAASEFDRFLEPPTLDIGGARAQLDWGVTTVHVPHGDLPVSVFVPSSDGRVKGATLTVRVPAGTGTRLTFLPPVQPAASAMLRIDGQWPADASMAYYAARDGRVLAPAAGYGGFDAGRAGAAGVQGAGGVRGAGGASGADGAQSQQPQDEQPPQQQATRTQQSQPQQRDLYGRTIGAGAAPIPTPAEFDRLEREAHEQQAREYAAWQENNAGSARTEEHPASAAASGAPSVSHASLGGPSARQFVSPDGVPAPIRLASGNPLQANQAWYRDPFKRADLRWFDGHNWTSSVMRGGVRATDAPG